MQDDEKLNFFTQTIKKSNEMSSHCLTNENYKHNRPLP